MPRPGSLILARIARVHGRRGQVRALLLADSWEVFQGLKGVWVQTPAGEREFLELDQVRPSRDQVVIKFRGCDDPEAAERLVGREVCIPREEARPLPEGTYYHYDIIGLQVVDETGGSLGEIVDILPTGANDVYVVRGSRGEWLLPAVREFIIRVDPDRGRMQVVRREGLVESEAL